MGTAGMRNVKESMRSSTDEAIPPTDKSSADPISKPKMMMMMTAMSPYTRMRHELEELIAGEDEAMTMRIMNAPKPIQNEASPPLFSNGRDAKKGRCLWLGGVDPQLTETELRDAFIMHGALDYVRLVPQKECAFVYFHSVEDAQKAMQLAAGKAIGRTIPRIGFGKQDSPELITIPSRFLWVGHLSGTCREEEVWEAFLPFGAVEQVRLLPNKNCAFVTFVEVEAADRARKEMQGAKLGDSASIRTGFAKHSCQSPNYYYQQETSSNTSLFFSSSSLTSPFTSLFTTATATSKKSPAFPSSPAVGSKLLHSPVPTANGWFADDFMYPIPALPFGVGLPDFLAGPGTLREMRRRVEEGGAQGKEEWNLIRDQVNIYALPISIDPMGNILLQRVMERMEEQERVSLVASLTPWLPALGIHKHGTWVVQRIIALAQEETEALRPLVADSLRPCMVALLQDQFGNYVIQGCLSFGEDWIAAGLAWQCEVIGKTRFGARAMRSCLEVMNDRHRRTVASAILENLLKLAFDSNGIILLTWLLDETGLAGRHALLLDAIGLDFNLWSISKVARPMITKLVQQEVEPAAVNQMASLFAINLPSHLTDPFQIISLGQLLKNPLLTNANRLAHTILSHRGVVEPKDPKAKAAYQQLMGDCEAMMKGGSSIISFGTIQTSF